MQVLETTMGTWGSSVLRNPLYLTVVLYIIYHNGASVISITNEYLILNFSSDNFDQTRGLNQRLSLLNSNIVIYFIYYILAI